MVLSCTTLAKSQIIRLSKTISGAFTLTLGYFAMWINFLVVLPNLRFLCHLGIVTLEKFIDVIVIESGVLSV